MKEKIPFFACSLLLGMITIFAQHRVGATQSLGEYSLPLRIANALVAYVKYIGMTVWPLDLAPLYPMPATFPFWQVSGSLCLLLVVSVVSLRAGRRYPFVPVGWFWYLITLVPAIGIIQVGTQSLADRFVYIPGLGLFIIVVWGGATLAQRLRFMREILALLAGAAVTASAVLTWQQLGYWRDNISLYRRTLEVTTGNFIIHHNLGTALATRWDLDGAIREFRAALRIYPRYADAHYNLGLALAMKGDLDGAIREFDETLRINPAYPKARSQLETAARQRRQLLESGNQR